MNDKDFSKSYKDYLDIVEEALSEYTQIERPACLYGPFRYLMAGGGKRVRPVLAMIACQAAGGHPDDALNVAMAIEIMHNFTLAHDDIMDESPKRRGRETVHVKYDDATAILLGDVMVGHGYKLLPLAGQHPRSAEINAMYTRGLIEVCEGQAYDMEFNMRKDVTLNDYFTMIRKKTSLLLMTSAVMGGHIAEAGSEQIEALEVYAECLGLAFQVQDDLLDLMANEDQLGKTVGLDILEGKKTYLILKALEKAPGTEHEALLQQYMNSNGLSLDYVEQFQKMMRQLGVVDDAENAIRDYHNKAVAQLNKLPEGKGRDMLLGLINKLSGRKY